MHIKQKLKSLHENEIADYSVSVFLNKLAVSWHYTQAEKW